MSDNPSCCGRCGETLSDEDARRGCDVCEECYAEMLSAYERVAE